MPCTKALAQFPTPARAILILLMVKVYQKIFSLGYRLARTQKPFKQRVYLRIFIKGDVVEDVRTVFERRGDASIYLPTFDFTISI